MVKKEVTGTDLFDNPRYFAIFFLIKLISDKNKKIRYKDLKYAFVKNHGDIDITNKRLMREINETLKFEEIDRKKSKYRLDVDKKLNVLSSEEINAYSKREENITDYGTFIRLNFEGEAKEFIFSSKSLLSNTLSVLINKKGIIGKTPDRKGNYYHVTNQGLVLFHRYYSKWIIDFLPDGKMYIAFKKLKEIANI